IIAKIHSAYPQLSVLWLMFGEGNMLTDANSQTSGAQNSHKSMQYSTQMQDEELFTSTNGQNDMFAGIGADSGSMPQKGFDMPKSVVDLGNQRVEPKNDADAADNGTRLSLSFEADQIASFNANSPKKIANIVVFYTDNSFQSFTPQE
ncbi:MAG: hypothetical protein K2L93_09270, partial [Muribaculaceae bacterium]|nr:hypothetical protein [Muribaculaceae bacterium]